MNTLINEWKRLSKAMDTVNNSAEEERIVARLREIEDELGMEVVDELIG